MEFTTSTGRIIELTEGDITRIPVNAIVNAANSSLAGGGGVDGAIHRAGGPVIMAELDEIRARIGRCPTGDLVVTSAGRLPADWVIHTVGPVYRDGKHGEAELLASCYRRSLQMADRRSAYVVSFPAISTGVYGYPLAAATEIAVREVVTFLALESKVERVVFVVFDRTAFEVYERELKKALKLRS